MEIFIEAIKALVIGIVEGITEWLPISSTGHMILVDEFIKLNVSPEFLSLFLVVIQIGAILAVIILYFHKLNPFSRKKTYEERRGTWRLWGMVVVGCLPAAVFGILLDDWVEAHLFNPITVAAMLILYGFIFIILERRNRKREAVYLLDRQTIDRINKQATRKVDAAGQPVRGKHARVAETAGDGDLAEAALFRVKTVDEIGWKTALKIGFFQVLAIVPGTSRSGATIIGGMLCGCSRTAAAEFTFFLAIPVMFGWGLVKAVKFMGDGLVMSQTEIVVLVVGIISAFIVSVIAIKFLMGYIKKNDFTAFGVYRIVVGIVVLAYFGVKMFLL